MLGRLKVCLYVVGAFALICSLGYGIKWSLDTQRARIQAENNLKRVTEQRDLLESKIAQYKQDIEKWKEQTEYNKNLLEDYIKRDKEAEKVIEELNQSLEEASKKETEHYSSKVPNSEWDVIFKQLR